MLVPNFLYKKRSHTLHGPSGDGKTMVAQAACVLLVKNGLKVVYLDEENGEDEITKRFLGLGLTADQLDEFVFCLSITEPQMKDAPSLVDRVVQFEPSLVVFDSAGDFYAAANLEENDNIAMIQWAKAFTQRLSREFEIATLLLEHENAAGEGTRARGATSKKQKVDASWHVKVTRDFDQAKMGEIEFTRTKDRFGKRPKGRTAKIGGDGKGHIFFDLDNPQVTLQQAQQVAVQKRQQMYRQTEQKLDEAGAVSAETGVTKNVLRDSLTGTMTDRGQYIEEAADDPTTRVRKGFGKAQNGHRSTVFWVEK
jgi:AAA domain